MQRAGGVAEQKAHGDEVQDHPEGAAQVVLGAPKLSRAMVDRNLGDGRAHPAGNGRNEAVQLAVEPDVLQHFVAVGFERAAIVVQGDAGDTGDERVGDARRQSARERGILTLHAPAADHVVAFANFGEQQADVGRVVLQIGVNGHDDRAARAVEAGGEGRGLAEVAAEAHDAHMRRVLRLPLTQQSRGAIAAAIVHDDDLEGAVERGQRRSQLSLQRGDALFFVE